MCIGDAMGVPYEGFAREAMDREPLDEENFLKNPGLWSDDSSLSLCLAKSLTGGFDLDDIARRFLMWLDEGYMTPEGEAFGIGRTTYISLENLKKGVSPTKSGLKDEYSNGNGSLMRILPAAFYTCSMDTGKKFDIVSKISSITHGHPRSIIACCIYVETAAGILSGKGKIETYHDMKNTVKDFFKGHSQLSYFTRVLDGDIFNLGKGQIRAGGYVIDTLEASLWCFLNRGSYGQTVLEAVNLGQDTDTTAAAAGGLAGTFYGISSVPKEWIDWLAKKDEILKIANDFHNSLQKR